MRALSEKTKNKKAGSPADGGKVHVVSSPTSTGLNKVNTAISSCCNCSKETKCRRRSFSEQAWTVLLLWNEISPAAVDHPICESCYEEMRDILIDRADEIEAAMEQREEVEKIKRKLHHLAS